MINTILFDLDGTLLPVDTDVFLGEYMKMLVGCFRHMVPPQTLVHQLFQSTEKMVADLDPGKTNQEVFLADFLDKLGWKAEAVMPMFDEFYLRVFPQLQTKICTLPSRAREVIAKALAKGYDIVIATNPVFPLAAIHERLRWIGAENFPYRLITSYENMHFCKPNKEYYQEILQIIGRQPAECLMVGNDVEEDLIAGELGMKTFLVDEFLINRKGIPYHADFQGSLADLLTLIEQDRL